MLLKSIGLSLTRTFTPPFRLPLLGRPTAVDPASEEERWRSRRRHSTSRTTDRTTASNRNARIQGRNRLSVHLVLSVLPILNPFQLS